MLSRIGLILIIVFFLIAGFAGSPTTIGTDGAEMKGAVAPDGTIVTVSNSSGGDSRCRVGTVTVTVEQAGGNNEFPAEPNDDGDWMVNVRVPGPAIAAVDADRSTGSGAAFATIRATCAPDLDAEDQDSSSSESSFTYAPLYVFSGVVQGTPTLTG